MIRITKLELHRYRGIKTLSVKVDGNGFIAKGRNGAGKTTAIAAIGAALAASDIGADAVTIGEKDGLILVDLDVAGKALHVKRRFGQSGSSVSVEDDDGNTKKKPTTVLQELLGSAPLDVVSVVLEQDPKKRKELILRALPVKADLAFLRKYVPALPDGFDVSGHGLEVIERLRAGAYEKRTAANKAAKETAAEAIRLASCDREQREKIPVPAVIVPLEEATAAMDAAHREVDGLRARKDAAARAVERTAGLRAQAEKLRREADQARESAAVAPDAQYLSKLSERQQECMEARIVLEARLSDVREAEKDATSAYDTAYANAQSGKREAARAVEIDEQAAGIEQGLSAAVETITDAQIEAALATLREKTAVRNYANTEAFLAKSESETKAAEEKAKAAQAEADRLDAVVVKLSKEAPAALLAETAGVPGDLQLDGDEVKLGGISLDKLCGAERMNFAAEIAKSLNPNCAFIVVDGLERLDPEQLDAFTAAATKDGRQLFGSLVDRGELVLAALSHETAAAAE